MVRSSLLLCAAACAALLACTGDDTTPAPPPPPTFAEALQGAFAACRNDGGTDYREVLSFQGSRAEVRIYDYATTNGTCGGSPILADDRSARGDLAIGDAAAAPDPAGAGSVTAHELDWHIDAGPTVYTLAYVDTSVAPNVLHFGDDSGTRDGSSDLLRPDRLQTLARARVAPEAALPGAAAGAWKMCRHDFGSPDQTEWIVLSGTTFEFRVYDHATTSGACGGSAALSGGGGGSLQFGAEVATTVGAFHVAGRAFDILDPGGLGTAHQLLWVDSLSAPNALYLGDDSATKGTALRPTALQTWPRYLTAVAQPAYPSALDGTWRSCVTEQREGDAQPWDYREDLSLVPAAGTFAMAGHRHSTSDGSCGGTSTPVESGSGTFTLTGAGAATLPAGGGALHVVAQWVTVAQTSPSAHTFYTLLHVDPYAPSPVLYTGDDGADPELSGSTAANRPTVLQGSKPRHKI